MNQKATSAKEQIKQIYCLEKIYAPFTELSEASVYFIHASCGCGALSERSELCGAIANKRMYEIRKRSVFSKRSVYSP